jgi:hypothetical protein
MTSVAQTQTEPEAAFIHATWIRRCLLTFALLATIAGTLVFPFPMEGRLWGDLFDLAHAPVFCVALLCLVAICDPTAIGLSGYRTVLRMTFRRVLVTAGILMTLGILCEYLQKFAGRSPSWEDVAANGTGILAALLWTVSRTFHGGIRRGLVLLVISVLLAVSFPTLLQVSDSVQQIRSFPAIASFDRPHEIDGWTPHRSLIQQSTEWATDGTHSMKVTLQPAKYPGVAMLWFEPNWSHYRTFHIDLRNPNSDPLTLVIRLNDRHNWTAGLGHHDRFHREVILAPDSQQSVVIDLAEVAAAPAGRKMDLHNMTMIDIFSMDLDVPAACFIDNIRLSP